ncbi:hypothetical protein D9M71_480260 [compost metagenome]
MGVPVSCAGTGPLWERPCVAIGLRQALDVYGDFQGFQRRLDLDAQRCTQLHYPGLMGGFAVMMFLDTALG